MSDGLPRSAPATEGLKCRHTVTNDDLVAWDESQGRDLLKRNELHGLALKAVNRLGTVVDIPENMTCDGQTAREKPPVDGQWLRVAHHVAGFFGQLTHSSLSVGFRGLQAPSRNSPVAGIENPRLFVPQLQQDTAVRFDQETADRDVRAHGQVLVELPQGG
jgi:hypothetical protein